jgi:PAS domain-containing protein
VIQTAQQKPHALSLELKTNLKNGETKWIRNEANPCPLEYGDIIWQGVIIDITEQILAREALRKSEQRFHEVFDIPPMPYLL